MLSSYINILCLLCACLLSDCGCIRVERKCFRWSAESTSSQHGRKPERPLSAALLQYTESSGFQSKCSLFLAITQVFRFFFLLSFPAKKIIKKSQINELTQIINVLVLIVLLLFGIILLTHFYWWHLCYIFVLKSKASGPYLISGGSGVNCTKWRCVFLCIVPRDAVWGGHGALCRPVPASPASLQQQCRLCQKSRLGIPLPAHETELRDWKCMLRCFIICEILWCSFITVDMSAKCIYTVIQDCNGRLWFRFGKLSL